MSEIIRNENYVPVDYSDTPFIAELNAGIEPVLKKYFSGTEGSEAVIILAIDSRDMGQIDGRVALAIKDKFMIYGSEDVLICSLGKHLNNKDGFFAGLISEAWANT